MTTVQVYSNLQVEKMYPPDNSCVSKIVYEALDNGLKIVSIRSNSFFGGWKKIMDICAEAINNEGYYLKYVVDVKDYNNIIVACSH